MGCPYGTVGDKFRPAEGLTPARVPMTMADGRGHRPLYDLAAGSGNSDHIPSGTSGRLKSSGKRLSARRPFLQVKLEQDLHRHRFGFGGIECRLDVDAWRPEGARPSGTRTAGRRSAYSFGPASTGARRDKRARSSPQ